MTQGGHRHRSQKMNGAGKIAVLHVPLLDADFEKIWADCDAEVRTLAAVKIASTVGLSMMTAAAKLPTTSASSPLQRSQAGHVSPKNEDWVQKVEQPKQARSVVD